MPYSLEMKMTMHINEDVLAEVMALTGAKSKTHAVEMALKDIARRHKMRRLFKAGLGLKPADLKAAFADYQIEAPSLAVAEEKQTYGTKPGPRRQ